MTFQAFGTETREVFAAQMCEKFTQRISGVFAMEIKLEILKGFFQRDDLAAVTVQLPNLEWITEPARSRN